MSKLWILNPSAVGGTRTRSHAGLQRRRFLVGGVGVGALGIVGVGVRHLVIKICVRFKVSRLG